MSKPLGRRIGGYVTVSAKVPRELEELMDKYGIKPDPIIRKALEEAVKEKILEEIDAKLEEYADVLERITDEEIAKLIREDRDRR